MRRSAIHAVLIGILSFFIAIGVSWGSEIFLGQIQSLILSFLLLFAIILIGIIFDIIGIAVTAADEAPFHAKASKKVSGATQGVRLIRNSDRVANFCNDVVGDISAAVAGAIGVAMAARLPLLPFPASPIIGTTLMTGLVAAFTVGGKALGKTMAITQADAIVFLVGRQLYWFEKLIGRQVILSSKPKRRKKVK